MNKEKKWQVEYDNDTGPEDGYYRFWYIVTDQRKHFECVDEDDAEWLCALLNQAYERGMYVEE